MGTLLDAEELAALRGELEAWAQTAPVSGYGLLYHNLWRALPGFRRLVEDGRIAARVRAVLGQAGRGGVVFFQDNLVCKLPGNPTEIQWHQDFSYWPLDRPLGLTTWLALDDADAPNGAMELVPGSHLEGERAPADFIRGSGQPAIPGLPPMAPEGRARAIQAARAGELCFHHPLVWHRSGGNATARPRRAWTVTWLLPEVRWSPAHAPHPYNWALQPEEGAAVRGELFPVFGEG